MGHSGDDAVHKIPRKMKTHWQNHLKISVLIWFNILYRIRYKKIDVILVQCPFNRQDLVVNNIITSCYWCHLNSYTPLEDVTLFKLWLTFCSQYCENKKFAKRRKLYVFQSKIQCRFQFWSKKYKILNLKIFPIDLHRARSDENEAKMGKNLCKKK